MDQQRVVKLNVGGRVFVTTASTLTQNGTANNFFTRLLSDKFTPTLIDGDQYFINHNGDLFAPLLDCLRTGRWHVPPRLDQIALLHEADFYGMELRSLLIRDDTIPLLRRMDAAWNPHDPEAAHAVTVIRNAFSGCLPKSERLGCLKFHVMEDKETVENNIKKKRWQGLQEAIVNFLDSRSCDVVKDSSLHRYLARMQSIA